MIKGSYASAKVLDRGARQVRASAATPLTYPGSDPSPSIVSDRHTPTPLLHSAWGTVEAVVLSAHDESRWTTLDVQRVLGVNLSREIHWPADGSHCQTRPCSRWAPQATRQDHRGPLVSRRGC